MKQAAFPFIHSKASHPVSRSAVDLCLQSIPLPDQLPVFVRHHGFFRIINIHILAFHIGGDDYVPKPYSLGVLLAKVKAVLKRLGPEAETSYSDGWLSVDVPGRQVSVNGRAVKLTALEFKLLSFLADHAGRVVSKQELFEQVWGDKFTGDGTLNVHIRKLREAIEPDPGNPRYIHTVWGEGYKFVRQGSGQA